MMAKRVTVMISHKFPSQLWIIIDKMESRREKIIRKVQIERSKVMTRFLRTDRIIYSVKTYTIGKI